MKYWDINKILPYQRHFNFINGPRSIGKTYTTQKFLIKEAIKKKKQFVYVVRTISELKNGAFEQAFEKVCDREYGMIEFKFENDSMYYYDEDVYILIGTCLALSNYSKIKMRSFPNVHYWLMDEYMLEENSTARYVNGWKEPDIVLSLYHTIDREEDRVTCFFLGNNTTFYNPYHLHPAFRIPQVRPGEIWTSENVLFQWALPSEELMADKKNSKFLSMISGTNYASYSIEGNYIEDNELFIENRPEKCKYICTIEYGGEKFGIWSSDKTGCVYIDNKIDPSFLVRYALDMESHSTNTVLGKRNNVLRWVGNAFKRGNIRFTNGEIKKKAEQFLKYLL